MGYSSTIANKTLGNPIYEESTRTTGMRVVDVSHGPKIEVSFAVMELINGATAVTSVPNGLFLQVLLA